MLAMHSRAAPAALTDSPQQFSTGARREPSAGPDEKGRGPATTATTRPTALERRHRRPTMCARSSVLAPAVLGEAQPADDADDRDADEDGGQAREAAAPGDDAEQERAQRRAHETCEGADMETQ